MPINGQVDISGSASAYIPIRGQIANGTSIVGGVSVRQKVYRELYFAPRSEFPEEGTSDVLYADTTDDNLYYWSNGEYVLISGAHIDDAQILSDATWSSNKILSEIDVSRYVPLSNSDILSILTK